MNRIHSFHIPVMGLAYTVDSPIKIAHLGISSVISIVDDDLLEKMRQHYSSLFGIKYQLISPKNSKDCRAERITSYLDLVSKIVNKKVEEFKKELKEGKKALDYYVDILPPTSNFKKELKKLIRSNGWKENLAKLVEDLVRPGDIDVNIMTKIDKANFVKSKQLPIEYNDAHAALRGFARSRLQSSVVLSAGMNPRLFSYFEQFDDFFPDEYGVIRKKIILKVSDFRSAQVQATLLAKKGLWISEYRIESGLNCGGHAFATEGLLMGPILEEFNQKKEMLIEELQITVNQIWKEKGYTILPQKLQTIITAQGGVGTAEEHSFLMDEYDVKSVGWGSPFLLVPEATTLDIETRNLLKSATEPDLYISDLSPLGVPFNTVKNTSNDYFRNQRINKNTPGSSCPKKYLALQTDPDPKGLCTASRKLQNIYLSELEASKEQMTKSNYIKKYNEITQKACLCVGLANSAHIEYNIPIKGQQQGVSICPGPNIAYFDKEVSLREMSKHIYGNKNILADRPRPFFLIKELIMYIEQLEKEMQELNENFETRKIRRIQKFITNLKSGIMYYNTLFDKEIYSNSEQITRAKRNIKKIENEIEQIEFKTLQINQLQ